MPEYNPAYKEQRKQVKYKGNRSIEKVYKIKKYSACNYTDKAEYITAVKKVSYPVDVKNNDMCCKMKRVQQKIKVTYESYSIDCKRVKSCNKKRFIDFIAEKLKYAYYKTCSGYKSSCNGNCLPYFLFFLIHFSVL